MDLNVLYICNDYQHFDIKSSKEIKTIILGEIYGQNNPLSVFFSSDAIQTSSVALYRKWKGE